jgi:2-methylisocitrate lyase-like PEP mutase family enzyme
MNSTATELREKLNGSSMVLAPFVYDALQAKIAASVGFEAVYMTGFGTAAARGFPDLGLLTMTEMVENVRAIARSIRIPVICDADTGYGNPTNVWRTVREYEHAGAAALHIEDQVWPKRCGFLTGKQVIPMNDMVPKVRAACDARSNPDTVIIARTDALAVNGWGDVVRRANAYRDAGADLIFVDGIRTAEDLENYASKLKGLPLLYNGQLKPVPALAEYGFKLTIHSATFLAVYRSIRDAMSELKQTGSVSRASMTDEFRELIQLLGVEEMDALGRKYNA